MKQGEKLEIIKRNVAEVVTEVELENLLNAKKMPVAYCGYEPNGPMHLGHFVTVIKLMDLVRAGFKVKVLLADIHAKLNRKGDDKDISRGVISWRKTFEAIGLKAEIVLGSDFQFDEVYQSDLLNLAQHSTVNRGLRAMQEIARDLKNATISQLWYPLMQVEDIKFLKANVAVGGMEQRKVHMMGKDLTGVTGHEFIALHTPLITSLKGPGQKMSKSIPGSGIAVTDSYEEIKKTLQGAYCPEKDIKDNPILQISKLIILPLLNRLEIKRPEKFGGNLTIKEYSELEKIYSLGKLHPLDLKNAVAEALEKVIAPIRKKIR